MENKILFIGLDVDDKNYHAHAIVENENVGIDFRSKPNIHSLIKMIKEKFKENYTFHFCYESTYSGYFLYREITKVGHECTIIAASLIPEKSGDKVKNDRLDAEKLAIYFMKGLLTPIYIPTETDEQVRALVRSRTFIKDQQKEIKKHAVAICKQLGWNYRQDEKESSSYWTQKHKNWLKEKLITASEFTKFNFKIIEAQINDLEERLNQYECEMRRISELPEYKEKIKALICYRGIDILSAMILITELGDIRRFSHPKKLTSYAGLDIREYSSGGQQRKYSITRMGNKFIRKILTEAAQNYNRIPVIGKDLRTRRQNIEPKYTEVADRCMHRIHKRGKHLWHRGIAVNKVKTACAREMLGFIWESLNLVTN